MNSNYSYRTNEIGLMTNPTYAFISNAVVYEYRNRSKHVRYGNFEYYAILLITSIFIQMQFYIKNLKYVRAFHHLVVFTQKIVLFALHFLIL